MSLPINRRYLSKSMQERAKKRNCEIFYVPLAEQHSDTCFWDAETNSAVGEGWFYWCCSPGCLPEGDAIGPFESAAEAFQDAETNGYVDEE